ncbi:MAG: proteasome accessory factor PafA2 family protein [Acidimicrobiia bacterium]
MQGRIYGVETEYGAIAFDTSSGTRRALDHDFTRRLIRVHTDGSSSGFLTNGGRHYLDTGGHPEYATPECDRIDDLVAAVFAGHAMLGAARSAVTEQFAADGLPSNEVHVYFNNVDSGVTTFGMHENFLVDGTTVHRNATDVLAPLLASLPVITGAGSIRASVNAPRVQISPRGLRVDGLVSDNARACSPMVKLHQSPGADRRRYGRFQVVCGESNPSEWALALRMGIIHLGLRLYEEAPHLVPRLAPEDSIAAIRRFSDFNERATVPANNRRMVSALELQEHWFDAASELVHELGAGVDDRVVLERWRTTLDAAHQGIEALSRFAVWAQKRVLVEGMQARSRSAADILALDYSFHTVDLDRNISVRAKQRGHMARVSTDDDIVHRISHPPESTRAQARANLLTLTEPKVTTCQWEKVITQIGAQVLTVDLPDPRRADLPALPDLMERLRHGRPLIDLPDSVTVREGQIAGRNR